MIVPGLSECNRRPVRCVRHSGNLKHLLAAYTGESLGDDLPHRLQGHLASVCAAGRYACMYVCMHACKTRGLRTIRTRPRCVCCGRVHTITNLGRQDGLDKAVSVWRARARLYLFLKISVYCICVCGEARGRVCGNHVRRHGCRRRIGDGI